MAQSAKRAPFSAAGPFIAKKNFSVFEAEITVGQVIKADVFERLHARRVQQLFDANYMDMADGDQAKRAKGQDEIGRARPLDRDGDGHDGGSLSDAEKAALEQAGLTLEAWLALPEPERVNALAAALAAAPPTGEGGKGASGTGGGEGGPETAQEGQGGAGGGDDTQKAAAGAPDASAGPVAAYKHFGFGKWFAIDAAGTKIGERLSKTQAEGLANRDGLPTLGMMDALPGA